MPSHGLKLHSRLAEAFSLAAKHSARAELVRIFGLGLRADGAVIPAAPADWLSRWEYAFCVADAEDRPPWFLTVLYLYPDRPIVTPGAGNVSEIEPFDEDTLAGLADSDRLVALFAEQPDFEPMAGSGQDCLVVRMRRMLDPVAFMGNQKGQSLMVDPVGLRVL
jgi:hypothetical protein